MIVKDLYNLRIIASLWNPRIPMNPRVPRYPKMPIPAYITTPSIPLSKTPNLLTLINPSNLKIIRSPR